MTLTVDARFSWAEGTPKAGQGSGRWRVYYRAEDLTEAAWRIKDLVPGAQIRIRDGKTVIVEPMLARDFLAAANS